jgi:hypothetical protein
MKEKPVILAFAGMTGSFPPFTFAMPAVLAARSGLFALAFRRVRRGQ